MNELLEAAQHAARLAGKFILDSSTKLEDLTIEQKSPNDFVSEVDRQAEIIIRDYLQSCFTDYGFIGEEFGTFAAASSQAECVKAWVVDPLDGTTNFLRGIAHFAVSIALVDYSEAVPQVILGVVYDPCKDEMFSAFQGHGSFLNGEKLMGARAVTVGLNGALVSTGIPFGGDNLSTLGSFQATMNDVLACQTSGIRRLGSAALDLAYVACGRYDGFWESNLKIWDIAAGVLLVLESGGRVSDFDDGLGYLESGNIVAAAEVVHSQLVSITSKNYHN